MGLATVGAFAGSAAAGFNEWGKAIVNQAEQRLQGMANRARGAALPGQPVDMRPVHQQQVRLMRQRTVGTALRRGSLGLMKWGGMLGSGYLIGASAVCAFDAEYYN